MKYNKLGLFLLVAALGTNLLGCENQFFHSGQSTNKETAKVKEIIANKENLQRIDKQKKLERLRKNEALLQKKIEDYLVSNNNSGSVFVEQNNQILFNEGVGYANVEKKILNEPATTYPIASITKIFVATSIMKLQEQQKLTIQDPISKYIPNFPNGDKIKLYNFLTHTSGIQRPHWHKGDTTPISLVREIEKMPLKFQPGEKWDYLDANYMVLGYVIEKITGGSLHDFIKKNIIDKVPLNETGFITSEHPVPYTSVGYLTKNNKIEPTKYLNTYALFGCGDIYATASDLSQFDQALMNGKLVSKESLNQMLTPSTKSTYGLGLYNRGNFVFSVGVLGGWYTMHAYYNDKTSIVILLNDRSKGTHNIENITADIYHMVKDTMNPVEPSPNS
ncbi:serine hydrolase domain-containing protein [Neobacillus ginsengisoli]|uniref:CubicO group peptidase (Beta-lactamase class C family) n=1 Tax=Neobacillus ginsengisoli TaxID=904295 RepID=A0ABT9XNJ3_9BACI|nr:serine hydrolase domain-containing protein [Neobacillus ginsengisoli]MDQ0197122.1 CubicO group peptidase (beta-lactamase class C family) [Neobacillus ginsengisoli]